MLVAVQPSGIFAFSYREMLCWVSKFTCILHSWLIHAQIICYEHILSPPGKFISAYWIYLLTILLAWTPSISVALNLFTLWMCTVASLQHFLSNRAACGLLSLWLSQYGSPSSVLLNQAKKMSGLVMSGLFRHFVHKKLNSYLYLHVVTANSLSSGVKVSSVASIYDVACLNCKWEASPKRILSTKSLTSFFMDRWEKCGPSMDSL